MLHKQKPRVNKKGFTKHSNLSSLTSTFIQADSGKKSNTKDLTNLTTTRNLLHGKSTYFYNQLSNINNTKSNVNDGSSKNNSNGNNKLPKFSKLGHNFSYLVPGLCGIAFLAGITCFLNPSLPTDKTYAYVDDNTPPTIALELSDTTTDKMANLEIGKIATIDFEFNVQASGVDGYGVYVQAASGYTGNLRGQANPAELITGVGTNISPANFANNTWGYNLESTSSNTTLDDKTFSTVPENGAATTPSILHVNDSATEGDNYQLTFAAKVGDDKPSDHYRTKILLSAITNPKEIIGFINPDTGNRISTMQEMTSAICANATAGYATRLTDTRDDKAYWVGKVSDQCIMTQNLDLDIPEDGLKAEDTDIAEDWNADSAYPPVATMSGTEWTWDGTDYDAIQSYDPGHYILNQATTSWSNCPSTKNPAECNRLTAITASTVATDLHYTIGNYYSYNAATAGSGPSTELGSNAPGSICPKGWKLFDRSGAKSFTTILTGKDQNTVRQTPFYFPAAGRILANSLNDIGSYARYWSSTRSSSGSDSDARGLSFNINTFNTSSSLNRYFGYSVRCVAK